MNRLTPNKLLVLLVMVLALAGFSTAALMATTTDPNASPERAGPVRAALDAVSGLLESSPSFQEISTFPQPIATTPPITATASAVDVGLQDARRHVWNGDPAAALSAYQRLAGERDADPLLLFEWGLAQMAAGDAGAAAESFRQVMAASPAEPLLSRAHLMEGTARLALGDGQMLLDTAVEQAPDGLGDLLAMRRAEAAMQAGDRGQAIEELSRHEVRESTNRLILEQAGSLAGKLEAHGLAGELYARATDYPAWTAQRSATMEASAAAFARAGDTDNAIEQYRALIEDYSWTAAARRGTEELWILEGLTAYHAGLMAVQDGRFDDARQALREAAASPEYAQRAAARLSGLDEAEAWRSAVYEETPEGYRAFRLGHPDSSRVAEAWFQEGFFLYREGQAGDALAIWDEASRNAAGDSLARLHLWAGKALDALGQPEQAQARLKEAAAVQPAGYYALRARDLLAGNQGWPETGIASVPDREAEQLEAEQWIAEWAGRYSPVDPSQHERGRRGLGLLALGLREEASAEMSALIAESDDPGVIFPLALRLAGDELWHPVYRAGMRLVTLSPNKAVTSAPAAIQRLVYPAAYWDLVTEETERNGLDLWLFLSLVYQESRYDPYAVSLAEARGLTQVIPSTGQAIAKALHQEDFNPERLHQPATSVRFGTWYLAQQLGSFDGDPFLALAAYNAGAGPVARWEAADPDLFVENIDYPETKGYVRQIYQHHAVYRQLAGG